VYTGPKNAPLRRPNFSRTWRDATEAARLTGVHFHDLRHTGNHIAAATGASLRELMGRMGHSTTRAALIYQYRTTERDRLIAATMSALVEAELDQADRPSHATGTTFIRRVSVLASGTVRISPRPRPGAGRCPCACPCRTRKVVAAFRVGGVLSVSGDAGHLGPVTVMVTSRVSESTTSRKPRLFPIPIPPWEGTVAPPCPG
jgi:Phage integrase family